MLSLLSLIVLPLMVRADSGDGHCLMDSGMMEGGGWGMMFFGLIYLAAISFVFSLIFWLVYKWITKK